MCQFKIGDISIKNPLILAPMAGITDLPTRLIARNCGAGLAYTEMISSKAIVMNNQKTLKLSATTNEDKPLGVQIFGSDPDIMAQAAETLEQNGIDFLDINMGCPVKKITKSNSGAALLKDYKLVEKILKKIVKSIRIPLTIKLRTSWNSWAAVPQGSLLEAEKIAAIAEQCGVAAISIHGRSAVQGYTGKSNWSIIKRVKDRVSVPVIGNGDVVSPGDVLSMIKETGVNGVMVGRAAIGNPWIFRQSNEYLKNGSFEKVDTKEKKHVILGHLSQMVEYYGEKIAIRKTRTHMHNYTKRLKNSTKFRAKLSVIENLEEYKELVSGFFS